MSDKYLIVYDMPTSQDVGKGLMSGGAGKLLKNVFKALGVSEDQLYFTTLVNHRNLKEVILTPSELEAFEESVLVSGYDKILFVGSGVCKTLFGTSLYYKRSMPFLYQDIPAICTYAPGYVLMDNNYFIDLCEDITKLVFPERIASYDKDKLSEYVVLQNEAQVLMLLEDLAKYDRLSLDIETTGLRARYCELRCIGIGNKDNCWIIQAQHFTEEVKRALEKLSRLVPITGHFVNFEYEWFFELGCDIVFAGDTILKHHEVDERKNTSRKLKWLGTRYFNAPNWSEILKDESNKELGFAEVPNELLYPYLAHDVKITDMVDRLLDGYVPEELYRKIMRGRRVLSKMTHYGIPIDRQYLFDLYYALNETAENDTEYLRDCLDNDKFNPRSAKMVANVLFEQLGFPKVDGESTGKKVMHQLRHMYPEDEIISKIDDTRKLLSAQSTFVKGMYQAADPDTDYMHGKFLQHVAATGRLSSVDPNLQNIPNHTELGKLIRNAVILPKGYDWMVEADYSQIEVYFAAILSKDKAMLDLLANGGDIYRTAASVFYGKPQNEVTKTERQYFKPIILGSLYLRGAAAIAEQNHTSVEEEQAKQDLFFKMYPDYYDHAYGKWMKGGGQSICLKPGALERAKQNKYIETMYGRKRRFPCILKDKEHEVRREALNSAIQGTASDVNFFALTEMYEIAENNNFLDQFRPWDIIHDACLAWMTDDFKPKCKEFMSNIMLNPTLDLPIKLKIEFKIGKRWGDMEEWED